MIEPRRRGGSWPWIASGCVVFVAGFVALRSQSTILAAEREVDALRGIAKGLLLRPATVLALRAGALDLDLAAFAARCERFGALLKELDEPLAAIAVSGNEPLARAWAAEPGGPAAAFDRHRGEPDALPGVAFVQRRSLFLMRPSGRDD